MRIRSVICIVLAGGMLWLTACASAVAPAQEAANATPAAAEETPTAEGAATEGDLLAAILARGVLRVSTDPAYPPQSELAVDVAPPADTKCSGEERPANQFTGFDIDVASEIARRLGVEACFVTPDWTLIVGGNWAGRWDISIGSMTITPERMAVLYFAQPYYTTPAAFFVHTDNTTFHAVEDLSGATIGVCTGCTYESYLNGTLKIPGETIEYRVTDATVTGYDTDTSALQDLALGDGVRLDAVLTAQPTGQGFADDGNPVKQLGDPVYFEYLAPAIDRHSPLDTASLLARVTELVQAMHEDGALRALSEKYYGIDLASPAATFDLAALEQ
jgi:polar amino acid transport system substrate-binding protein